MTDTQADRLALADEIERAIHITIRTRDGTRVSSTNLMPDHRSAIVSALRAAAPAASGDVREVLARRVDAECKAEMVVRERLANNGRNPANNNQGIRVGSDLHLMEMLIKEIDDLRSALSAERGREDFRNWIVIRDPGCVPDQKGPFKDEQVAQFLREVFKARPTSFVEVITVHEDNRITVQDAPEALETTDGRSSSIARKHRDRLAALFPLPAGNMDKSTSPLPLPSEPRLSTEAVIEEMHTALVYVRSLISEAAMTGFNHADGEWATRLFESQHYTTKAIKIGAASRTETVERFAKIADEREQYFASMLQQADDDYALSDRGLEDIKVYAIARQQEAKHIAAAIRRAPTTGDVIADFDRRCEAIKALDKEIQTAGHLQPREEAAQTNAAQPVASSNNDPSEALSPAPVERGRKEVWCQPMDCGKHTPRKFLLYFDDPDHGNMVFDNENEARDAFNRKNTAWNCYLFGSLPLSPLPARDGQEEPVADETHELFAEVTKTNLADAVAHLRTWTSYIDHHWRRKYADLLEDQAKLIAHLIAHPPVDRDAVAVERGFSRSSNEAVIVGNEIDDGVFTGDPRLARPIRNHGGDHG